jgi:hypothetical protein
MIVCGVVLTILGARKLRLPQRVRRAPQPKKTTYQYETPQTIHPDYTKVTDEKTHNTDIDDPNFFDDFERESAKLDE